jgi:hypothetical protein
MSSSSGEACDPAASVTGDEGDVGRDELVIVVYASSLG